MGAFFILNRQHKMNSVGPNVKWFSNRLHCRNTSIRVSHHIQIL